jgi:hypothetical protein
MSKVIYVKQKRTKILEFNKQGPPGPPGLTGPAGADTPASYLSGGVNAYQIVFVTDSGAVLAANANNPTHAGRIVGITEAAAAVDATVSVRRSGSVANPVWALTPGARYYLQAGGEIGTNTDGLAFTQKIGVAESATSLFLQIEAPILN